MEVVGSIYTEVSERFQHGIIGGGISRCVKAETHDLGVVMAEIQEKRLGNIYSFDGGNYAGNVYDKEFISPTLKTMQGGNSQSVVVAMRGRNPDNPSDRTTGSPTEQRLEVNMQGTSNCLTSVQKDNMVLESILAVDEQNMNVRKETFGTLTTDGSSPKHNNRVMIKQATKQGYAECELGGVADLSFPDSATRRGRVQECGNVCPTIMAQNRELCRIETQYRIRKLTPRECGRLMGVSDEDIEKMAAVNSNTQLYKQFGNSIVVDVMCAMFRNLNIEQE